MKSILDIFILTPSLLFFRKPEKETACHIISNLKSVLRAASGSGWVSASGRPRVGAGLWVGAKSVAIFIGIRPFLGWIGVTVGGGFAAAQPQSSSQKGGRAQKSAKF